MGIGKRGFSRVRNPDQEHSRGDRLDGPYAGQAGGQGPPETIEEPPIGPRRRTSPYPLSPGQRGIWFFRELAPDVPLYNESEAVRLRGELDIASVLV
jgi:hypothetical protein